MPLFKRILYYLGGVGIGIIILYFFIGGSGASCEMDYFPDARVMKNIRLKNREFSPESLLALSSQKLDTAAISYILKEGDVNFGESDKEKSPCPIYIVYGKPSYDAETKIKLTIENCENKAVVQKIEQLK